MKSCTVLHSMKQNIRVHLENWHKQTVLSGTVSLKNRRAKSTVYDHDTYDCNYIVYFLWRYEIKILKTMCTSIILGRAYSFHCCLMHAAAKQYSSHLLLLSVRGTVPFLVPDAYLCWFWQFQGYFLERGGRHAWDLSTGFIPSGISDPGWFPIPVVRLRGGGILSLFVTMSTAPMPPSGGRLALQIAVEDQFLSPVIG